MNTTEELLRQALDLHRGGQRAQAEALYRRILQSAPERTAVRINLGAALMEQARLPEALDCLEEAVRAEPDNPIAQNNLGNVLGELGRPSEALVHYERAIALRPDYANAYSNRSQALLHLGRAEEALASADQALQLDPRSAAALNNCGKVLAALSRDLAAREHFDRALAMLPGWPTALANRSSVLLRLGQTEDALRDADQALRTVPHDARALNSRGAALRALQRHTEALRAFEEALRADATLCAAQYNRGMTLVDLGQAAAALVSFERAIGGAADCAEAHYGRGIALTQLKRTPEAAAAFEQAIEMQPELPYARGLALHSRLQMADWHLYEERRRAVIEACARGEPADEPFSFLSLSDSASAQLECAQRFAAERHPARSAGVPRRLRASNGKLHVGYLSADFGEHPVSRLMVGVFERHDRRRLQVSALSLRTPSSSPFSRRVQAAFDRFIDVRTRADGDIARLIGELQVDVLVDLMGYTRGTRLGVLSHRAAPVQVSYLGYPGTLGAPYVDYIIADESLVPIDQQARYAEAIAWLPQCFQANDAWQPLPPAPSRAEAGLPAQGLVLCCFNTTSKINPPVFDLWCRLLASAPDGVLWLLGEQEPVRASLQREARHRGIAPERLVFAGRVSYEAHLARLQLADLFLDTFPFNAGATASDALRAGVPVLTCRGEAYAARMAGSLLHAAALDELITDNPIDYERLGAGLCADRSRLQALKQRLQTQRSTSPLFDAQRFAAHLEAAYHAMWQGAQRAEPPTSFKVQQLHEQEQPLLAPVP